MKIISHRGLINGPDKNKENSLENILKISNDYPSLFFEIDVWLRDNKIYIGHELNSKNLELNKLKNIKNKIILHIKSFDQNSPNILNEILEKKFHYFSHENDDFAITSWGWPWVHPKCGILSNSICVMPEKFIKSQNLKLLKERNLLGVCTDFPLEMLK